MVHIGGNISLIVPLEADVLQSGDEIARDGQKFESIIGLRGKDGLKDDVTEAHEASIDGQDPIDDIDECFYAKQC